MLGIVAILFVAVLGGVELGSVKMRNETLQTQEQISSWVPDCTSGEGKAPLLIPNPRNCKSLFICSGGVPKEFFCAQGMVFSPERQQCGVGRCKPGGFKKWPAFEVCPDDWSISKYFRHESDCAMFYQCDNGDFVPHRCPPNTVWNNDEKACDHPWNVDCLSRLFIAKRSEENTV